MSLQGDNFLEDDSSGEDGDEHLLYRPPSRMTASWDSVSEDEDSSDDAESLLDDVCREVASNQTSGSSLSVEGRIGDAGTSRLSFALKQNSGLTALYLRDHDIGPSGAKMLLEALSKNRTLLTLDLLGNCIGDDGAHRLALLLRKNRTLTALRLGTNEISYEGAAHLAEALRWNDTLQCLALAWNYIGDAGANHMARMLATNTTLLSLDLGGNTIGTPGAKQLVMAVRQNSTLTRLFLGGNGLQPNLLNSISAMLAKPAPLVRETSRAELAMGASLPRLEYKCFAKRTLAEEWREEKEVDWEAVDWHTLRLAFTVAPPSGRGPREGTLYVGAHCDWQGFKAAAGQHSRLEVSASDPTERGALSQALLMQEEELEFAYKGEEAQFDVFLRPVFLPPARLQPTLSLSVTFQESCDDDTEHVLWERTVKAAPSSLSPHSISPPLADPEAAAKAIAEAEISRAAPELLDGFLTLADLCQRATRAMCARALWFYVAHLPTDAAGEPCPAAVLLRPIWSSFQLEEQSVEDFLLWLELTSEKEGDGRSRLAEQLVDRVRDADRRKFTSLDSSVFRGGGAAFSEFAEYCRGMKERLTRGREEEEEDRERERDTKGKRELEESATKELETVALLVGVQGGSDGEEEWEGSWEDVEAVAAALEATFGSKCTILSVTDRDGSKTDAAWAEGVKRALLACVALLEERCKGGRRRGQLLFYYSGPCCVAPEGTSLVPAECAGGEGGPAPGFSLATVFAAQQLLGRPLAAVFDCVRGPAASRLLPSSSNGSARGGDCALSILATASQRSASDGARQRGRLTSKLLALLQHRQPGGLCFDELAHAVKAELLADGVRASLSSYPLVRSADDRRLRCFHFL